MSIDYGELTACMALQRIHSHRQGADPQACTVYGIGADSTGATVGSLEVYPADDNQDGDGSPILAAAAVLRATLPSVHAFGIARLTTTSASTNVRADTETRCVATIYDLRNTAVMTVLDLDAPEASGGTLHDLAGSPIVLHDLLCRLRRGDLDAQTWAVALTLDPPSHPELIAEMAAVTS